MKSGIDWVTVLPACIAALDAKQRALRESGGRNAVELDAGVSAARWNCA